MPADVAHLIAVLSEMAILFVAIAHLLRGATDIVEALDRFTARFRRLLRTIGRRR